MRRTRFYHKCVKKEKCVNPRQGALTREDYTPHRSGSVRKICNECLEARNRKTQPVIEFDSLIHDWLSGRIGAPANRNCWRPTYYG